MTSHAKRASTATIAGASLSLLAMSAQAGNASDPADRIAGHPPVMLAAGAQFRDGTYTATGQYGNQPSFLTVTVTLAADNITSVVVRTHATNPISLDYQRRFAAAVPAVVIGRPISAVKVGRLAGSSGCPDGFNDAIARIKAQAGG